MSGNLEMRLRRRLPLAKVLWGAFVLPWRNRAEVARVTGLPLLAVVASTLALSAANLGGSGAARWTLYFVYSIAVSWLAISVHRLVLLGRASGAGLDSPGLKRLGRFVAAMLGLLLVYLAVVTTILNFALMVFGSRQVSAGQTPAAPTLNFDWLATGAGFVAMWPVARVSLLFPAIARDQPADFIAAWMRSRGNGWRLAIIVGALPWALNSLSGLLYRDGATWVEFGVLVLLVAGCTIIQVVALSLSYWELTRPEPPPTPPPD